ncbi:MAG: glycoside hydrolase family 3 N-terminal domain-containing protein [Ancrocorticia sp.]
MKIPKRPWQVFAATAAAATVALSGCSTTGSNQSGEATSKPDDGKAYTSETITDGETEFIKVTNPEGGPVISYTEAGLVKIIEEDVDGKKMAFKDANGDGTLQAYEDWRLAPEERAKALADELTTEQLAGLMLMSPAERAPEDGLTDIQEEYLDGGDLRTFLNSGPNDVTVSVQWNNEIQAFVETLPDRAYIPVTMGSDPRSDAVDNYVGAKTADISAWPGNLGLAALDDPARVEEFAKVTSEEFRAMGLTITLAPQVDLGSDPRWLRLNGTFGDDSELAAELATAYVDGYQKNGNEEGWGEQSVMAVIKHFAGDGTAEGGRGTHIDEGKYNIFPGDNWDEHLVPFKAALQAGGAMTSYGIALDKDGEALFERIATAYDAKRVGLLRDELGFDGIIFSDWNILKDPKDPNNPIHWGEAWGAEDMTFPERMFTVMKAGIDIFGGEYDRAPLMEAIDLWNADHKAGKLDIDADTRMRQSTTRFLTHTFRVGTYENPFVDLEKSMSVAQDPEKIAAGFIAQTDSVVVLKNTEKTITCDAEKDWSTMTAYIPGSYNLGSPNVRDLEAVPQVTPYATLDVESAEAVFGKVVTDEIVLDDSGQVKEIITPDISDVDIVLVGMKSPDNGSLTSGAGRDAKTGEWYPLSLQYRPYTADGDSVRKTSISGDILDDGSKENRSYFGGTSQVKNEADLDAFERAIELVEKSGKDIPVVTVLKARNPIIPTEFESKSTAIVSGFGVSDAALIDVALGRAEFGGKLPIAFPADMETVEAQLEDVPMDYTAYVDSEGNEYKNGFGLSCSGDLLK